MCLSLINTFIQKGALEPVPVEHEGQGIYFRFFFRPQSGKSWRLIIGLRYLNRSHQKIKFKMEMIKSVTSVLQRNDFMASLNLTNAYLHVRINPASRIYLSVRICHHGRIFSGRWKGE